MAFEKLQHFVPGKIIVAEVMVNLADKLEVFGCVNRPAMRGIIDFVKNPSDAEQLRVALDIGGDVFAPCRIGVFTP